MPETPSQLTGQPRVLIVDDEEQVRRSLGEVLEMEGFDVAMADGPEALERFLETGADIVLLDLNMPACNGWKVHGQLKAEDANLPIIIMTGRPALHAFASGSDNEVLMEKPLEIPTLLRTIADLLKRGRMANA